MAATTMHHKRRILHVIQRLAPGGAGAALIAVARRLVARGQRHEILSLLPPASESAAAAEEAALDWVSAQRLDEVGIDARLSAADAVVVHAWNTPELDAFLRRAQPPARWLAWLHVTGDSPPHVLTPELTEAVDALVATTPYTATLPAFRAARCRTAVVLSGGELAPLFAVAPTPHEGLVVGYLGAVDEAKIHPELIALSVAADLPGARFEIRGWGDAHARLEAEVAALSDARVSIGGWVDDVPALLAGWDVLGYPLRRGAHATAELALQEAMAAGVVPVVLDHGAVAGLVEHDVSGLVARDEDDYPRCLERLARDPALRRRLSDGARAHARERFGADRAADGLDALLAELCEGPRRSRPARPDPPTGAGRFLASLGAAGAPFARSLAAVEPAAALTADEGVASVSAALASGSAGGVLHWRLAWPDDPWLRLWAGLTLARAGQRLAALGELSRARALGGGWRAAFHLARVATDLGARPVARAALADVLAEHPDLPAARSVAQLLDR